MVDIDSSLPRRSQERRGAFVQTLTGKDIELLTNYGKALDEQIYRPSQVSDSVFENIMGVPTVRDLVSCKGTFRLLLRGGLLYVGYIVNDLNSSLSNYTLFKKISGKENYYPFLAIKERDVVAIFQTGSVYLFRLISGMPSYGAQCVEGSQRFMAFVKRISKCKNQDRLFNPKNSCVIASSSAVLAAGAGIVALPKLYSMVQQLKEAGSYGGNLLYISLSLYYLSNFYKLFDSSSTYTHSKINQYCSGDTSETAFYRKVLLELSQNSITKWFYLSNQEKTERYAKLFSPQIGDMKEKELYQMLFFLLDFGKTSEPIVPQKEPLVRQGLRWFSEGIAALAGPISFEVIKTSARDQLISLGCGQQASEGVGYAAASIGSVFTMMLSRTVVKNSLTQVYDAWTGYKHQEDIASSLYDNSSSGYTSHPRFRKCLTTYNQLNGNLLGLTMGKSIYDALPILPTWIRYSAAGIAMIGAGSVETLFLQRWTHKLVNVVDKTVLQKTEKLKSLADPVGVMSDEMIEYARNTRLWITRAPAPVVEQLYKLALTADLRQGLLDHLQPVSR